MVLELSVGFVFVEEAWMRSDWGCYSTILTLKELIRRLLMCGYYNDDRCDIPIGEVYGLKIMADESFAEGQVNLGRFRSYYHLPISQ